MMKAAVDRARSVAKGWLVSQSFLSWMVGVGLVVAAQGQAPSSCESLVEQGRLLLQNRPSGYVGDIGRDGRPLTENARRHQADTKAAMTIWRRARDRCLRGAENATDRRESSRLTAWGYWVAGESLLIQGQQADGCEMFAKGVEAVQAIDAYSPYLEILYKHLGNCVSEWDGPRAVALIEEGLNVAIHGFGERDARLVDSITLLAIALPYRLAPSGDLADASGPEVAEIEQRVAELFTSAWEIVQEDPKASVEAINKAADFYCHWLKDDYGACADVRTIQKALIAERSAGENPSGAERVEPSRPGGFVD